MKIWACEPNALQEYLDATDVEIPAAALQGATRQKSSGFYVKGRTAIIPIKGVLTPNGPGLLEQIFGVVGTAYGDIAAAATLAAEADEIDDVILDMDTPGGTVSGVDEAWSALKALASAKPVTAINRGMIASAGYWLASAADEILASTPTAETGSIGVVLEARDYTEADAKRGVKKVQVVSKNAPNKRPDIRTDEGVAVLQKEIDDIEKIFIQRVSEGRGVDASHVEKHFGQGGVMLAEEAKAVGMIDGFVDLYPRREAGQTNGAAAQDEGDEMELEQLEKELAAVTAERDLLKARISAVSPFVGSNAYPAAILAIAGDVLTGKEEPAILKGAVIMHDSQVALKEQEEAAAESAEIAEGALQVAAPLKSDPGVIATEEDVKREVARLRGEG